MAIPEIHIHIHDGADEDRVAALEEQVVTLKDDVLALNAKVEEYNQDVLAKVGAIQAALDAADIPGAQAALATLAATVDAGVAAVGDADGDGNPAPAPAPEPVV